MSLPNNDNLNSSLVCRLCIKFSDSFYHIDYIRKPLETILPNLDLSLTKDPVVVCFNCASLAIQCHTFIKTCLEKNKKIQDHHNRMNIKIVDLDSLVKNSIEPIEPDKIENPCDWIINYTCTEIIEKNDQNLFKTEKEYQDLQAISASENEQLHQESESKDIIEIFKSDVLSDGDMDTVEDKPLEENSIHNIVVPEKNVPTEETKESDDCIIVTDSENEFEDNENNDSVSQQKTVKKTNTLHRCLICHKNFEYKQHLNGKLVTKLKDIPDVENNVTSKIQYCFKCFFQTIHKYEGGENIDKVKQTPTSSQSRQTNLLEALEAQQKALIKTNTKPRCLICRKSFVHKQHLNGHLLTKHKDIPDIENVVSSKIHQCPACSFKTIRNYELTKHMQRCRENRKLLKKTNCNKAFACKHCDVVYKRRKTLQRHILSEHEDETYLADRVLKRKIIAYDPTKQREKRRIKMNVDQVMESLNK